MSNSERTPVSLIDGVQVVAHRGASAYAYENTLEAFKLAAEMGSDWVEMDVRMTQDGMLVVHHDAQLTERFADSEGLNISDTLREELPAEVPTFAEALEVSSQTGVVVEIKNFPNEPGYDAEHQISLAVAGTLNAYHDLSEVLVISFNFDTINRINDIDPKIPTGFLVFDPVMASQSVTMAAEASHTVVSYHVSNISESLVSKAHEAGLLVHTWTVNDKEQIEHCLECGVDAIVSDDPQLARKVVDKFSKS